MGVLAEGPLHRAWGRRPPSKVSRKQVQSASKWFGMLIGGGGLKSNAPEIFIALAGATYLEVK